MLSEAKPRLLGQTRAALATEVLARGHEQRRCDAGHDRAKQRTAEASGATDHGVHLLIGPRPTEVTPAPIFGRAG